MPIQYVYVNGKKKKLQEYILSCSLCGIPAGRVQHPGNSHSINYFSAISDSKRSLILKQRPNHRMNLQKKITVTIKQYYTLILPQLLKNVKIFY